MQTLVLKDLSPVLVILQARVGPILLKNLLNLLEIVFFFNYYFVIDFRVVRKMFFLVGFLNTFCNHTPCFFKKLISFKTRLIIYLLNKRKCAANKYIL